MKEAKNYTVTFIDKDLKRRFYFAGFMRTQGTYTSTGCLVITKKYTKEEAIKIKERIIKYCGEDKTLRIVKVGK